MVVKFRGLKIHTLHSRLLIRYGKTNLESRPKNIRLEDQYAFLPNLIMKNLPFICAFLFSSLCYNSFSECSYLESQTRVNLLEYAHSKLGLKYGEQGYDCSAYVRDCYRHIGIRIPRDSKSQLIAGKAVSRKNVAPGDLVIFKGSNKNKSGAGHTAIIVSCDKEHISFIHASVSKGICIDNLKTTYYQERLLGFRQYILD